MFWKDAPIKLHGAFPKPTPLTLVLISTRKNFVVHSPFCMLPHDGQEELLKSRKWSARNRDAQDKFRRVWEERGSDYVRLQQAFEEAEAAREEKLRQRRETEAAQVPVCACVLVCGGGKGGSGVNV